MGSRRQWGSKQGEPKDVMDRELEKWALQQQLTADWTAQESDEQKAIRDNKIGVNEKKGGASNCKLHPSTVRMTTAVQCTLADVVHEI